MNDEVKAEEKTQTQQASTPAPAQAQEQKQPGQKKKINRLSLKELEKELKQVQEKMKGLHSAYAQQLLKRKEQLLGNKGQAEKSGGI